MPYEAGSFCPELDLNLKKVETSSKEPKPHQQVALAKLAAWYKDASSPPRGTILVLPTGGGKTFTAVRFACQYALSDGYKVLWLAHTHHLLEQPLAEFELSAGTISGSKSTLRISVVSGASEHRKVAEIRQKDDVVIGSLQAISKAMVLNHESLTRFVESAGDKLMVVFDEAHHSPAPSYRRLLQSLREICPTMLLLGLTATPRHEDAKKEGWLLRLFPQGIVHQVTAELLIAAGILAKPILEEARTKIPVELGETDYAEWIKTNRDLPEHVIADLAQNQCRNDQIVDYYVKNKERLGQTVIFADRWTQCEYISAALAKCGVTADSIYSKVLTYRGTPEKQRHRTPSENAEILERFRSGKLQVLLNVRMLTEGTDVPQIQSVFLTRQTTSQILLTQMVGRALRGPEVGGTAEAYIVSFIDDWKQRMNWADFTDLPHGESPEPPPAHIQRAKAALMSIDLVRRFAEQIYSGIFDIEVPFFSFLPLGWYQTEFKVPDSGTGESEPVRRLILVYEHEKAAFDQFIEAICDGDLADFEEDSADSASTRDRVGFWGQKFFAVVEHKIGSGIANDILCIARHMAQHEHIAPQFFQFEARMSHDVEKIARRLIEDDLGPRKCDEFLQMEFYRADLFWQNLYSSQEQFKSFVYTWVNEILRKEKAARTPPPSVSPQPTLPPADRGPSDEVAQLIRKRDNDTCLCCGSKFRTQIDHIKSVYRGGTNDPDNLQVLCKKCNGLKEIRRIDFRQNQSPLKVPLGDLPKIVSNQLNRGQHDAENIRQSLIRAVNFFFECAAVKEIVETDDANAHFMTIELRPGIDRSWILPHLKDLEGRLNDLGESLRIRIEVAGEPDNSITDDESPELVTTENITLETVIDKIMQVEGFRVVICHGDGQQVNGDIAMGIAPYPFHNRMNGDNTVDAWKRGRFLRLYPMFDSRLYTIKVVDKLGVKCMGQTKLRNLRP